MLRDGEYRRLGTVSFIAGIDLQDGTVEGIVRERHRSCEFVELLEALDAKYPEGHVIRLVLDNHSVHRSRETRAWLEGHPGRFEMVFTPRHGSWLNVIEGFFGKMARQVLRHIRVRSLDELRERIELHDQGDVELVPEGGCPAEDEAGEGGDAEGGIVVEQLAHGLASPQGVLEVRLVVAADVERQAELEYLPRFHQPTAAFLHGLPLLKRREGLNV